MTEIELLKNRWQELLDRCPLDRKNQLAYGNVSQSYFSVARYSGGCRINGATYIYEPLIDAIIREDVHAWVRKNWQPKKQQENPVDQPDLFTAENE